MKSIILFAFMSISLFGFAQEEVPENVLHKFSILFPNAEDPEWESDKENEYQVEFDLEERRIELELNAKGEVLSKSQELFKEEIPPQVQLTIDEKYSDYEIMRVMVEEEGEQLLYDVELMKELKGIELELNSDGQIIEQEDDEDEEDQDKK